MISVIIPVYNEEENLPILAERLFFVLRKLGGEFEVIFVDDGSTDKSLAVMRGLRDTYPQVRIIKFERNCGQTAAFDCGFKVAKGAMVVTLDADLQNDPNDIPKMIEKLKNCDMVYGWRRKRRDPLLKLISSKIANYIRNKLSGEDIKDTGCSLKAYKKDCLNNLKLYNGMHRFLPTLVKLEGFKVAEVEVSHHPRKYGKSKYNVRKRLIWPFLDLLAVSWMKKRHLRYEWEEI
ncbi:MAG: glycosyltransferase family 2 protein [Candidatus Omnitrophota bacterium]|nr:glycosyltransferase family 2 protein [Candidatus Omnitrophota bacterium]